MRTAFTKIALLATGLTGFAGIKLMAQAPDSSLANYVEPFSGGKHLRTWSIGFHGGWLSPFTVLGANSKQDFTRPQSQIGYGGYIKKQLLPSLAIQADFLRGKVEGKNSHVDETGAVLYSDFSTEINWATALSLNITLANINWRHKEGVIQPYLTAGAGNMNYTPRITPMGGSQTNFETENGGKINEVYIPLGLGLKLNIASGVNLDFGYQVNFMTSDKFDGYVYGTGTDRFSYAHFGLEFALGSRKKPQMAVHNPVSSMRQEYLMANRRTRQDLQAQLDQERIKNEQLQQQIAETNANLAKLTADTDGDGVLDVNDKCPGTPPGTKVDGSGCPLPEPVIYNITEEDKKVVNEAIRDLEFDLGKTTIRERSYASLDRVVKLLVEKNFSLKLAGHTDNIGSPASNMKLSKARAEAVKAYLVSGGANASRIEATGYGQTQPIASNKTAEGRQQNRRVEFTLF